MPQSTKPKHQNKSQTKTIKLTWPNEWSQQPGAVGTMLSECENRKLVDAMLNYQPYQGTGVRNQEIQKSGKVRNVTNIESQKCWEKSKWLKVKHWQKSECWENSQ